MIPINNDNVAATFLTQENIKLELESQRQGIINKYNNISMCSRVVVALAIAITSVAVGILGILFLPGTASFFTFFFIAVYGPMIGGGSVYLWGRSKDDTLLEKINRLQSIIVQNQRELQPHDRIDETHLKNTLQEADWESLLKFIPKMDYDQLRVAYKTLGAQKLRELLDAIQERKQQHQAWQDLLSLAACSSQYEYQNKLEQIKDRIQQHQALYPTYQETALALLRKRNLHQTNLLAARRFVYDEMEKMAIDKEDAINLVLKDHTIVVLPRVLTRFSNYFEAVINDGMDEGEQDLELDVEDAEAFKEIIRIIEDKGPIPTDPVMIKRIYLCANKYFDRYADVLRDTFSESQLRSFGIGGLAPFLQRRQVQERHLVG